MTTVYDQSASLAGTDDGDGDANSNFRQRMAATNFSPGTGTRCQLQLLFGTACPTEVTTIDDMYFGQAGASGLIFTGNQVHVTFNGGSGSVGGSAAGVVNSDVFTLGELFDSTHDYCFSVHWAAGSAGSFSIVASATNTSGGDAGASTASQTSDPGMSSDVHTFLVQKIFITQAGASQGGVIGLGSHDW